HACPLSSDRVERGEARAPLSLPQFGVRSQSRRRGSVRAGAAAASGFTAGGDRWRAHRGRQIPWEGRADLLKKQKAGGGLPATPPPSLAEFAVAAETSRHMLPMPRSDTRFWSCAGTDRSYWRGSSH